jgi:hypothetical protein
MKHKTSSIPLLQYILVDTRFTHEEPIGFQEAEWVQTVAIPDRAWGLNVVFRRGGAMYRNIPPHAISFGNQSLPWSLNQSQLWNCYGYQHEHMVCDHLGDSEVMANVRGEWIKGRYLFQTSFIDDSYSLQPEQDKTFFWIRLDNDRLTILPTNKVTFIDASFVDTTKPLEWLKLQTEIYRCDEI